MEGKLPQHNTRVKLPMTSDRLAVYDGKLRLKRKVNSACSKENFSGLIGWIYSFINTARQ